MLLFYLMMVLVCSCNPYLNVTSKTSKIPHKENCTDVIDIVNSNWKKHKKLNIYYCEEDNILRLLQHKDCLVNTDTSVIIDIFGEPSKNERNFILKYYLQESCLSEFEECNFIMFTIDKNGIVTSFEYATKGKPFD